MHFHIRNLADYLDALAKLIKKRKKAGGREEEKERGKKEGRREGRKGERKHFCFSLNQSSIQSSSFF